MLHPSIHALELQAITALSRRDRLELQAITAL
jgi:hypothetical protein